MYKVSTETLALMSDLLTKVDDIKSTDSQFEQASKLGEVKEISKKLEGFKEFAKQNIEGYEKS